MIRVEGAVVIGEVRLRELLAEALDGWQAELNLWHRAGDKAPVAADLRRQFERIEAIRAELVADAGAELNLTQAANLSGMHVNTIRNWCDSGELEHRRVGPGMFRRVRLGSLLQLLANDRAATEAERQARA